MPCKDANVNFLCKKCTQDNLSWYLWRLRNQLTYVYRSKYPPNWLRNIRIALISMLIKNKKRDIYSDLPSDINKVIYNFLI